MRKTSPEQFGGGRPHHLPYTVDGIRRLMCSRAGCARPAFTTWSGCADGNMFRPLCAECDVELNRIVQEWWGDPAWEAKLVTYANRVQADVGRALDLPWLTRTTYARHEPESPPPKRPGRHGHPDSHYAAVAAFAIQAHQDRQSVRSAISEHYQVTVDTADKWLARARRRGHLKAGDLGGIAKTGNGERP